jgi:hypothetical protein
MIKLEPHSIGELLTEVTREYTRHGMPSSTFSRVITGMHQSAEEMLDKRDAEFVRKMARLLETLRVEVQAAETEEYSSGVHGS